MFRKYTILTLSFLAVGSQIFGMTALRRLSPATIGAMALGVCGNNLLKKAEASEIRDVREFSSLRNLMCNIECEPTYKGQDFVKVYRPWFEKFADQANQSGAWAYSTPALFGAKQAEAVEELVRVGANPNFTTSQGETPLHQVSKVEVAEALIKNGAKVNVQNYIGETPLLNAIYYYGRYKQDPKIISTMLAAGANPNTYASSYRNSLNGGVTPLMLAIDVDAYALVPELIKAGAYVNAQNNRGMSALHMLSSNNNKETLAATSELLQAGANPYLKNIDDKRPVDFAREQYNYDFIKTVGTYRKCSWRRPFERDVTGLSDSAIIDQVLDGKRATCTR